MLYFKNSFIYALITLVISLFFNSMAAYSFARLRYPGRDAIFAVYLGTMMILFSVIMIPLSKPILLTQAIFSFKGSWNNYLWPTIVNDKSEYFVISQGLSKFASYNNTDWNSTLAGSAVSMIPIIIVFVFFQRKLVEGVKMSGVKG